MKTILILGAGKSATYLIDYLADSCVEKERKLILADLEEFTAVAKLKNRPNTQAASIDTENAHSRKALIGQADVVISMLPAFMHPVVAKDCLELGKHFFTASYESDALREMAQEIEAKKLFFLNECGLVLLWRSTFAPKRGQSLEIQIHLESPKCSLGRSGYFQIY
jgi:saccharopine dehydrogenase-like NADP-dependent oxidoreductase